MKDVMQEYLRWLNHDAMDRKLFEELENIKEDQDQITERFYTHLSFGTGGLRGELGAGTNRINIYTVRKATLGLAKYILGLNDTGTNSVVIAYDCRHMSPQFAEQAALTLAMQGIKAYVYPELRSTPQLSFSVRRLQAKAGIMITASHNPPEYNGYKVYGSDGAQLNLEEADKVIQHVQEIDDELAIPILEKELAVNQGLFESVSSDLDQQYIDYVNSISLQPQVIQSMADQYKIVFTPLHGTALMPVQEVFKQAGFKQVHYIEEQSKPDPNFSTVSSPNPEEHDAFALAISYAQEHGADIIMGTDPDADRMGIVVKNNEGEYVVLTGNQTGALLVHYLLSTKKDQGQLSDKETICKTIVTSELGRVIGEAYGVDTIDTLTGFKFIGEKIKQFHETEERRFLFGYEESYGYLIGDEVRDKDAIQAVFLAAEMGAYYKSKEISLYDALQNIYRQFGYFKEHLISYTLKGLEGIKKITDTIERLRISPPVMIGQQKVAVIEDYETQQRTNVQENEISEILLPSSNVLKYFLEDGTWCCIRPSGTEPKLKVYIGVEAESNEEADSKLKEVENALRKIINL